MGNGVLTREDLCKLLAKEVVCAPTLRIGCNDCVRVSTVHWHTATGQTWRSTLSCNLKTTLSSDLTIKVAVKDLLLQLNILNLKMARLKGTLREFQYRSSFIHVTSICTFFLEMLLYIDWEVQSISCSDTTK